ncbi:MAG: P1 family peptidase [Dehalococcoidia bacterium]
MARARDLGIVIGSGTPGPNNAITDVSGVQVGYATVIEGSDVRTGVTLIVPFDGKPALFAGTHRLNGCGEMTGLEWIRESGMITSPIAITNTHSVGAVYSALIAHAVSDGDDLRPLPWSLPVVAETWDGRLNDINGMHVRAEHVEEAFADLRSGPVAEGNVGGGTGMVCHGFKGGTGTASRVLDAGAGGYTVGVLVQANHGRRQRLQINGVPVGEQLSPEDVPLPGAALSPQGSIIVVVATDAPLLPGQCDRLAQRAGLGIARTGGAGETTSGDLFIAFATGNRNLIQQGEPAPVSVPVQMLQDSFINHLFYAVIEATEEAIVNALLAAETMTGKGGVTAHRLEAERLIEIMTRFGRRVT